LVFLEYFGRKILAILCGSKPHGTWDLDEVDFGKKPSVLSETWILEIFLALILAFKKKLWNRTGRSPMICFVLSVVDGV